MKFPSTPHSARISEIFSSLQGEGVCVGQNHIFIRFDECHIECTYCDEINKPAKEKSVEDVLAEVERLDNAYGPHQFISLTGGEPLLYVPFLKSLIPALRQEGFAIYLETNGILWRALSDVLNLCDCIAMDMKPSSMTGEKDFHQEHEAFLNVAKSKEVFVKMIVSDKLDQDDFVHLVRIIESIDERIPLILQPLTIGEESVPDQTALEFLINLQRLALRYLQDVRIVPRLHKMLHLK